MKFTCWILDQIHNNSNLLKRNYLMSDKMLNQCNLWEPFRLTKETECIEFLNINSTTVQLKGKVGIIS